MWWLLAASHQIFVTALKISQSSADRAFQPLQSYFLFSFPIVFFHGLNQSEAQDKSSYVWTTAIQHIHKPKTKSKLNIHLTQ